MKSYMLGKSANTATLSPRAECYMRELTTSVLQLTLK